MEQAWGALPPNQSFQQPVFVSPVNILGPGGFACAAAPWALSSNPPATLVATASMPASLANLQPPRFGPPGQAKYGGIPTSGKPRARSRPGAPSTLLCAAVSLNQGEARRAHTN